MLFSRWSFALLFSASLTAFSPAYPGDKATLGEKSLDAKFVVEACERDMSEITLGMLAKDKAENVKVREFAKRLMDDHLKSLEQLKSLAKKHNLTVPVNVSMKYKEAYIKLAAAKGFELDRQFLRGQIEAHQEAKMLYRDEAQHGKIEELRSFAQTILPTIEMHLKQAKELSTQVGEQE
jgi:putative membrane protein